MKKEYEIVIGLEIHAELDTETKVFCGCKKSFGEEPNTNCCPICVGFPGTMPVLNKKAVENTIMAGLAVGSKINKKAVFERKNYFYPDLSKAYQISQLEHPICLGGGITLSNGKFVRLNRIHLEEDAGKLIHGFAGTEIDYNRGGLALMEVVSEPDISNADEAVEFLEKLRGLFVFSGVARCRMEKGEMRFDVNLSIKEKGSTQLGKRTEMKNLNSFKSVSRAIEFESARQIKIIESGGEIDQETRKWDDEKGESFSLRSKEDSQDYRYFPDPDILEVEIEDEIVERLRLIMPLMPEKKKEKYISELLLPEYDADILTSSKIISDFFDEALLLLNQPKEISNWIMTEVMKLMQNEVIEISPENLVEIIKLVLSRKITRNVSKDLFLEVWETKQSPIDIANKKGMIETISEETLTQIVETLIGNNPKSIVQYNTNPDKIVQFFVGGIMKETKGKADPLVSKQIIIKKITEKLA